jgi:hypothetical protein
LPLSRSGKPSELTWCIELDEGVLITIHILREEGERDTVNIGVKREDLEAGVRIFIKIPDQSLICLDL